jgi:hypothetical protein
MGVRRGYDGVNMGDTGWGRWMRAQRTVEIGFGSRHYEREHANSCFRNFYVSAHGSFSTFEMCFHVNSHLLSLQPHKCQNQAPNAHVLNHRISYFELRGGSDDLLTVSFK